MAKSNMQKTIKDDKGNEVVMIRVDKTPREMMEEKPTTRWDPNYWHPKFDLGRFTSYKLELLGRYIVHITYGQVGRREFVKKGPNTKRYLSAKNFIPTGIDWELKEKFIKIGGWNDPQRSRPNLNDVLLVGVGVATTGRVTIIHRLDEPFNFGQDIKLLRLEKINPYFVCIYLKSRFGQKQINRFKTGVGTLNLDFNEIKAIKIPVIPDIIQSHIESEYKKMSRYHDKAMEAKKKSDEKEYKKNIEIAEKMLKDLIAKTEAVIRGERKDVI